MGLNKYQKCDCTSSAVAFHQKSVFDFLNPFTDISGYLNLWNIFRFVFRQLRMTFIKLWWQKKIIFLQMYNTIFFNAKSKVISKCKNDKPWKKWEVIKRYSPFKKKGGGGSNYVLAIKTPEQSFYCWFHISFGGSK